MNNHGNRLLGQPFSEWQSYIQRAKGQISEDELIELIKQCCDYFKGDRNLKDNEGYVRLWLRIACLKHSSNPIENIEMGLSVTSQMMDLGIGLSNHLFWTVRCEYFENYSIPDAYQTYYQAYYLYNVRDDKLVRKFMNFHKNMLQNHKNWLPGNYKREKNVISGFMRKLFDGDLSFEEYRAALQIIKDADLMDLDEAPKMKEDDGKMDLDPDPPKENRFGKINQFTDEMLDEEPTINTKEAEAEVVDMFQGSVGEDDVFLDRQPQRKRKTYDDKDDLLPSPKRAKLTPSAVKTGITPLYVMEEETSCPFQPLGGVVEGSGFERSGLGKDDSENSLPLKDEEGFEVREDTMLIKNPIKLPMTPNWKKSDENDPQLVEAMKSRQEEIQKNNFNNEGIALPKLDESEKVTFKSNENEKMEFKPIENLSRNDKIVFSVESKNENNGGTFNEDKVTSNDDKVTFDPIVFGGVSQEKVMEMDVDPIQQIPLPKPCGSEIEEKTLTFLDEYSSSLKGKSHDEICQALRRIFKEGDKKFKGVGIQFESVAELDDYVKHGEFTLEVGDAIVRVRKKHPNFDSFKLMVVGSDRPYSLKASDDSSIVWEYYVLKQIQKRCSSELKQRVVFPFSFFDCLGNFGMIMSEQCGMKLSDVINFYRNKDDIFEETLLVYYALELLRILSCLEESNIKLESLSCDSIFVPHVDVVMMKNTNPCWDLTGLKLFDLKNAKDIQLIGDRKEYGKEILSVCNIIHKMIFHCDLETKNNEGVVGLARRIPVYYDRDFWNIFFEKMLNKGEIDTTFDYEISMLESYFSGIKNISKRLSFFICKQYLDVFNI